MLAVLGDGYIAQHIDQCILQEERERLYRRYITDSLLCISDGKMLNSRWVDLDPGWAKPAKEEDAESIKFRLKAKINGEEGDDESICTGGKTGP